MDENNKSITLLNDESKQLVQDITSENDEKQFKRLIQLFNVNQYKKNVVRNEKLGNLLDDIIEQMSERISKRSTTFSNQDLLGYMSAVQQAIKNTEKISNDENIPLIQINNEINIKQNNDDTLDRASKERIKDVISKILAQSTSNDLITAEYIDKTEEET